MEWFLVFWAALDYLSGKTLSAILSGLLFNYLVYITPLSTNNQMCENVNSPGNRMTIKNNGKLFSFLQENILLWFCSLSNLRMMQS